MKVCTMRDTRMLYNSYSLFSLYLAFSSIFWCPSPVSHWLMERSPRPSGTPDRNHIFLCTTIIYDVGAVAVLGEQYSHLVQLSSFEFVWVWGHCLLFFGAMNNWASTCFYKIVSFELRASCALSTFSAFAIPAQMALLFTIITSSIFSALVPPYQIVASRHSSNLGQGSHNILML